MDEFEAERPEKRMACRQYMQQRSLSQRTLIARSQDERRINGLPANLESHAPERYRAIQQACAMSCDTLGLTWRLREERKSEFRFELHFGSDQFAQFTSNARWSSRIALDGVFDHPDTTRPRITAYDCVSLDFPRIP